MTYSISQLASVYDLSLRTLRFYEQRGLLRPARAGTARIYSEKDRITLELILKGRRLGFSLSEIELLLLNTEKSAAIGADTLAFVSGIEKDKILEHIAKLEGERLALDDAIAELKLMLARLSKGIDQDAGSVGCSPIAAVASSQ